MNPTDVEISRALNALSTTLRDQRPSAFDAERVEQIARGALAGERKLSARATGATAGELTLTVDGRLVALIELQDGQWSVERKLRAGGSDWALPQPAHREQAAQQDSGEAGGEE
jgi:nitrogen fixation protein FixH